VQGAGPRCEARHTETYVSERLGHAGGAMRTPEQPQESRKVCRWQTLRHIHYLDRAHDVTGTQAPCTDHQSLR
jgi:hypothetical protein